MTPEEEVMVAIEEWARQWKAKGRELRKIREAAERANKSTVRLQAREWVESQDWINQPKIDSDS